MFDYRLVISRQGGVRQSSKLDHKSKTEESSASIRRSAVVEHFFWQRFLSLKEFHTLVFCTMHYIRMKGGNSWNDGGYQGAFLLAWVKSRICFTNHIFHVVNLVTHQTNSSFSFFLEILGFGESLK